MPRMTLRDRIALGVIATGLTLAMFAPSCDPKPVPKTTIQEDDPDEVMFGFPNDLDADKYVTTTITEIEWDRHDSTIHIAFEDKRLNAFYEPCDQFHVRIDVPEREWD